MKLQKGLTIVALLMTAGGCGGSGTNDGGGEPSPSSGPTTTPPPPPEKSGISGFWGGVLRVDGPEPRVLNLIALVAETGEFRWLAAGDSEQLFGDFTEQLTGTLQGNADRFQTATAGVWAVPGDSENPQGARWGDFTVSGFVYGHMVGEFRSEWPELEERIGTFQLIYQRSLYEQGSSLARLEGTWRTDTESLAIDDHGTIFFQSSADGCTGNGAAEVIDPAFNMYRLRLTMDGCTGARAVRNGLTFDGLGYIGANNDYGGGFLNSTIAFAVSSANPDANGNMHPIAWSLLAHKQ